MSGCSGVSMRDDLGILVSVSWDFVGYGFSSRKFFEDGEKLPVGLEGQKELVQILRWKVAWPPSNHAWKKGM